MTQAWAIFYDAYRSLNAKKMFWIVLILSGLIVASFGAIGINKDGLKIFFWQLDNDIVNTEFVSPAMFYKTIFVTFGISIWLAWLATILALISTAGIFPDLISSGSIDLVVSKPIGRLRLFLLQYAAGLLFVTLQVTLFTTAGFLVIGLRGGVWEPGLFVAVPLVVCLFSYLFGMCVFLGVLTRSTVASLLLTLLFWFVIWGVGRAEKTLLMFTTMQQQGIEWEDLQQEQRESPGDGSSEETFDEKEDDSRMLEIAHDIVYGVKTVLPKTDETAKLLERSVISMAELNGQNSGHEAKNRQLGMEIEKALRGRSIAWVVGTSLGFELFFVACAAWIFCRRDF